ncbi:hypothetical protein BV22DRAFT_1041290 [Leucogyrophana mollusca]|uniref:Uncharacterized protein n=1 Tax=Leucogyrophana mollusca TaxID=85980 RepID=A0ACB8B0D8_9AGAM|nr:hypothetical protein BV22DRAFT_1041290 [Leucogyrophana mollusca]
MDWDVSMRDPVADESNGTKDLSADSMVPPARNSAPRYHFHGLAATQTQSQYEGFQSDTGSQKENTPTSNDIRHDVPVRTRSSSPHAPPAKLPNKGSHADPLSHPHSRSATGVACPLQV